jgi:hypothetical protein
MYVFFGFSSTFGYLSRVHVYNFRKYMRPLVAGYTCFCCCCCFFFFFLLVTLPVSFIHSPDIENVTGIHVNIIIILI